MFLRKLAFAVGRLDFWNLPREMTAFQLAVHRAAMDLDPVGEERADMRAAMTALLITQSGLSKAMSGSQINDIWKALTTYTLLHQMQPEKTVSADQAAQLWNAGK